jgi:hypothetical protein
MADIANGTLPRTTIRSSAPRTPSNPLWRTTGSGLTRESGRLSRCRGCASASSGRRWVAWTTRSATATLSVHAHRSRSTLASDSKAPPERRWKRGRDAWASRPFCLRFSPGRSWMGIPLQAERPFRRRCFVQSDIVSWCCGPGSS